MDGHLNFLSTVRYQSLTQKDCLQILIQRVEEFHIFRPNLEVKYLAVLQDPVFVRILELRQGHAVSSSVLGTPDNDVIKVFEAGA